MVIETTASQSRNIQTSGAPRTPYIPEDLIEEIFLQLPVKSLWRFRLVTASWRSLIDSNRFIRIHLQNSTRNPSLVHYRVLLASHHHSSNLRHRRTLLVSPRAKLSQCSLLSLFKKPDVHPLEFNIPTDVPLESISLVGCCDGLVCALLNNGQLVVWNPSTRMFKNLPPKCNYMHYLQVTGTTCYGFGYDKSSEDYKVFWGGSSDNTSAYTVYSLKTDSWKGLTFEDTSLRCCGQGKLASGKLHWQGIYTQLGHNGSIDSSDKWEIVSFDMSREEYGTVEQPYFSEEGIRPYLGKLGECLSMVCYDNNRVDVWVMKEYGVKESWEKVSDVLIQPWPSAPLYLIPFCVGPEGEIVLMQGGTFFMYYQNKWRRRVGVGKLRMLYEADIYVQSLVSPLPADR